MIDDINLNTAPVPKKIGDLKLYSVDDLSEMLGVSKMTLRSYLRTGKLKGRKLGVRWFITEESLRSYFQGELEPEEPVRNYRYVVQGINDLVSEKEMCETVEEALESINSQAIISLFQVAVIDRSNDEVIELIKARDFLERYE